MLLKSPIRSFFGFSPTIIFLNFFPKNGFLSKNHSPHVMGDGTLKADGGCFMLVTIFEEGRSHSIRS
jgi:hypothetical protein